MDDLCIILHVGVGKRRQQKVEQLRGVVEEAIRRGREAAEMGAEAMSVVKECIRALEDSPLTNAGLGELARCTCRARGTLIEEHC